MLATIDHESEQLRVVLLEDTARSTGGCRGGLRPALGTDQGHEVPLVDGAGGGPRRGILLAPAHDLLNSTIVLGQAQEELALPLNGRKSNLSRRDLVDYFGRERLALPASVVHRVLAEARAAFATMPDDLAGSLLSREMQQRYQALVDERSSRLFG